MPKLFKNPLFLFLLKAIGLYLLWLFLYDRWLHPQGNADLFVIDQIVWLAGSLLELMGFELSGANPLLGGLRTIGIGGSDGVWIGDPCNGPSPYSVFLRDLYWPFLAHGKPSSGTFHWAYCSSI